LNRNSGRNRKRSTRQKSQRTDRTDPAVDQDLRITDLGRHCDGIGVAEGGDGRDQYFVPFALPGEMVRAKTVGKRAQVLEVLEPSTERIEASCPQFGRCGGCAAQHLQDLAYQTWKRGVVETALLNRGLDVAVGELIDGHGDGRRRVTFHVRFAKGRVLVGFMQARSRNLVELDTCPILVPALQDAPEIARALALPFAGSTQQLDIAITETLEGLDCDIRGVRDMGYDAHVALAEQADACDLARVSIDGEMALERRKPMVQVGSLRVPLPPACFLQATTAGEEILAQLIRSEIGDVKKIADLFCGIGPFALRLTSTAAIYAVDNNEAAIAAMQNAVRFGVGLKPVTGEIRDLFRNPVYHEDLNSFDAVIINPARAGAEAQAREIALSDVPVIVYVSCDPASLARDAELLIDGGYHFERAIPVDQFKYAAHIETVAVFRRK
jgi:23S rRNA (uracil1939-C5)-methyltransferase